MKCEMLNTKKKIFENLLTERFFEEPKWFFYGIFIHVRREKKKSMKPVLKSHAIQFSDLSWHLSYLSYF